MSLIIVCCHAIYNPSRAAAPSVHCESDWLLQPYQQSSSTKPGEHGTFLAHITAALSLLHPSDVDDPGSQSTQSPERNGRKPTSTNTLVLSGGRTHPRITDRSEAASYRDAMLHLTQQDDSRDAKDKDRSQSQPIPGSCDGDVILEEMATDSYQNLLFSIIAFRKVRGVYPKHITIITHDFKRKRFLDLHAKAIRWPQSQISVHGIDPVQSEADRQSTLEAEARNGYNPWLLDPYASNPPLSQKRTDRGWHESQLDELAQGVQDRAVKELLRWRGGNSGIEPFPGTLPWDE